MNRKKRYSYYVPFFSRAVTSENTKRIHNNRKRTRPFTNLCQLYKQDINDNTKIIYIQVRKTKTQFARRLSRSDADAQLTVAQFKSRRRVVVVAFVPFPQLPKFFFDLL